jgi:hypothetical protein
MNWEAYRERLAELGLDHWNLVVTEDPDELGYTLDLREIPDVRTLTHKQLRAAFDAILPTDVQNNITHAAYAASGVPCGDADEYRKAAGYGGC